MVEAPDFERLLPDDYDRDRLAIGVDYDERTVSRLKNADWDLVHQDWQPDYQFDSGRTGAWVVDATAESTEHLNDRLPVTIPDLDDIPYSSSEEIRRLPEGPVGRPCPECENDALVSEHGARQIHPGSPSWIRVLEDSSRATHICSSCKTVFEWLDRSDEDRTASETDPDELMNTGPEQRARYLEREHDLSENEARALAYRECGYSASGIAGQIDVTTGTVRGYLRSAEREFGLEATETKQASRRSGPLGGDL